MYSLLAREVFKQDFTLGIHSAVSCSYLFLKPSFCLYRVGQLLHIFMLYERNENILKTFYQKKNRNFITLLLVAIALF